MNEKVINDIVRILRYIGPDKNKLISEAILQNKEIFLTLNSDGSTELSILMNLAYDVKVTDIYLFSVHQVLIKQSVNINGEKSVLFDKLPMAIDKAKEVIDLPEFSFN